MSKELSQLWSEGRHSRLDGWEQNLERLRFLYYPDKGEESPLFAHIIAMSYIKDGCRIPDPVMEVIISSANRGKKGLARGLNRWNKVGFLEFDPMKQDHVKMPAKAISYTFGKFDNKEQRKRTKSMLDALKFESSIFSSVSIN